MKKSIFLTVGMICLAFSGIYAQNDFDELISDCISLRNQLTNFRP